MSTCPRCGVTFSCSMEDNSNRSACWCMQVPPLSRESLQEIETSHGAEDCLCPACLQALSAPPALPVQF